MRFPGLVLCVFALGALCLRGSSSEPARVTYEEHVKPVLQKHCVVCHSGDQPRGDLDLSAYATLVAGSASGKVVIAG